MIDAKIGRETGKSLTFPNRGSTAPEWIQNSGSQIFIPEETIKGTQCFENNYTYKHIAMHSNDWANTDACVCKTVC